MKQFEERKYVISGITVIIVIVMIIRLFYIQMIDSSYKAYAYSNSRRYITQYPARGLIFDRNNKLIVSNKASYDLMVNPMQLEEFDTTELCSILSLEKDKLDEQLNKAIQYSRYKPSPFLKQLSSRNYAVLQEKLYKFPGFFVQPRTIREYNKKIAAHMLGYVGEVDKKKIEQDEYYKTGDYIGISGIEKSYENVLRGKKGVKIYLVDVHNRIKGAFQDGRLDEPAVVGTDIQLTIDADLQEYGECLMKNKVGSIVAIHPPSGEVLSLVSSPGYTPDLLVGRPRTKNYKKLATDTLKPLFNRALMAKYPPGSTFKLINALIGLQEKVVSRYTKFYCYNGYRSGPIFVGCHNHPTPLDLPGSIQCSCNAYYCNVFSRILNNTKYESVSAAFEKWREHVVSFGFNKKLSIDLPNEGKGFIPHASYYDKYYGENRWSHLTVISLSIGQGEILITPLQMANMTAAIANRGVYYTPHLVREIKGDESIDQFYKKIHQTTIDSAYYETIIDGMDKAVNGAPGSGSTARIARLDSIIVCGKTGTAQNPHGEDHSIFIAFAPKEDPQIAISVYVERGGFGSRYAAPIARLMIEKYMADTITRPWLEKYILDANLLTNEKKN